ncbi:MAG TPA: HU family DNA-binding protein [Anaerovoracaceae bacterium]|nr:HU family DNA-binding protein [Anaerovoracaceae bacterium]
MLLNETIAVHFKIFEIMTIKFRVIERSQPGVAGGGEKMFYAAPVVSGTTTLEDLTHMIEKISTLSGADVHGAIYALVDVAISRLEEGEIVRLGELGSLRISLSSVGKTTAAAVKATDVKGTKIIFTPGKRIKKMIKSAKFQKQ